MKRLIAALAVVSSLGLAGCGAVADASSIHAPSPNLGEVLDQALPATVANLPLQRPDGTTTTLASYRGKPLMIADYMTLCEDICPMITANTVAMGRALAASGLGNRVALLEITIDPHRDSLQRIAAYQKLYAPFPSDVTLLRASPANSAILWKYFGVAVKRVKEGKPADTDWLTGKPLTYDIDHSDALIFLDGTGRERFVVDGGPDVQGRVTSVPARLRKVLSSQGKQDLHHPDAIQDWTVPQGLGVFSWLLDRHIALHPGTF